MSPTTNANPQPIENADAGFEAAMASLAAEQYRRVQAEKEIERLRAIVDSCIDAKFFSRKKDGTFAVKEGCLCPSCQRSRMLQEYVDARP